MTFENTGNQDGYPFNDEPFNGNDGNYSDDQDSDWENENQGGDWGDWMLDHVYGGSMERADADLPFIRDDSEVYDFGETDEVLDETSTPEVPKSDLEKAMEYMSDASWDAFEAAAEIQQESRKPRDETSDEGEITDDTAISRLEGLQIDQEANLIPYGEALKSAGLIPNPDPILAGFQISDGDKFASTLEALPNDVSPSMRSGLSGAVNNALGYLRAAHTANTTDADFSTYGTPREASEGFAMHGLGHSEQAATEVLAHAGRIGTELERIGAHEEKFNYVAPLWEAKVAESEGMLPHWALADSWGLYDAPTSTSSDQDWTRWSTEQWSRVDEFIADAAFHAPADSAFMNRLVTRLHANIGLLRQGDFLPGHVPLPPGMKESKPYYPQQATPEKAASYDEKLAAIQAQLKSLSGDIL